MKIVILDAFAVCREDLNYDFLNKYGEVISYHNTKANEVIERIGDAEVVITNKVVIDKNVMDNTDVKYLSVSATGVNCIDMDYAKEKGILVTNVGNYSTDFVAQHTIAFILEALNHVSLHNESISHWLEVEEFSYELAPLRELNAMTVGVVGFGNIAKKVIKILQAFGANILVYNRTKYHEFESDKLKFVDFDELLKSSDLITLHVPLTNENKYLINEKSINKMKTGVIVVNTARGPLVNESDMLTALNDSKVACYLADVLEVEPAVNKELLMSENTIITPHIAWSSYEARQRLMSGIEANLEEYLNSKKE